LSTSLEALTNVVRSHSQQIAQLAAQIGQVGDLIMRFGRVVERQGDIVECLGERIENLAEAQKQTDVRLNALINVGGRGNEALTEALRDTVSRTLEKAPFVCASEFP
jgi:hypothetical protein